MGISKLLTVVFILIILTVASFLCPITPILFLKYISTEWYVWAWLVLSGIFTGGLVVVIYAVFGDLFYPHNLYGQDNVK